MNDFIYYRFITVGICPNKAQIIKTFLMENFSKMIC